MPDIKEHTLKGILRTLADVFPATPTEEQTDEMRHAAGGEEEFIAHYSYLQDGGFVSPGGVYFGAGNSGTSIMSGAMKITPRGRDFLAA